MKGKTGKKNLVPVVKKCEKCGCEFLASSNYVHFCEECGIIAKKERRQRVYKKNASKKHKEIIKNGIENAKRFSLDIVVSSYTELYSEVLKS